MSLPYPNGRTLRPINLVYEVPTPFLLLYYQTHFIFLGGSSWWGIKLWTKVCSLNQIDLFIYLFWFGMKNNFTNRYSARNICNSSWIEIVQGIFVILLAYNSCYQIRRVFSKCFAKFLIILFLFVRLHLVM